MEYRVLARKYRPASFADLIGQEVLVRTLSNAIKTGRLAHAFVLTGIRGIGKTTTARIIARALNCEQGPTIAPCGECANCRMIAEDRHPDVLEMDAASRTGVGDIRDLIETVHYAPISARYKIYIIDEVHMLSTSAFNALLKTLEEPPPHVKFIFATTEARKIPVTILSRCQRFDLKRVAVQVLAAHLGSVAQKEGAALTPTALTLLATAAEGSVRDGLSLLDQAIAHGEAGQEIGEEAVRAMLGLAGRAQVVSLFELVLKGEAGAAVTQLRALYEAGADPLTLLQDMLEFSHFITRIKLVPAVAEDVAYSEHERVQAKALAQALTIPTLSRLWQLLLKGVGEVKLAPSPVAAAEMVLVRACYTAELPTPGEMVKRVLGASCLVEGEGKTSLKEAAAKQEVSVKEALPFQAPSTNHQAPITDFTAAIVLLEAHREALLASQLRHYGSLVSFAPGRIELHMKAPVGREFAARVGEALSKAAGSEWKLALAERAGEPTLQEQQDARKAQARQEISADPLVASVMAAFPGAEITDVKEGV